MKIEYLTIKKTYERCDIIVNYIKTDDMIIDHLTKGHRINAFKKHVFNMGLVESFVMFGCGR